MKSNAKTNNINIILATKTAQPDNTTINDYIIKPFVPSELVSKIRAFASQHVSVKHKKILQYNDIEMNVSIFRVTRAGRTIHLGPNEFKIFQCFLELPGRVLSREHIMNYVWGHDHQVEPRTIDVHINRLRAALKADEDEMPLIRTIRYSGYALSAIREAVRV